MSAYIPHITKVSSIVTRILGRNPGFMTLQGTNTYLLGSGSKRILLDTSEGNEPEYINDLKSVLASENASLENIILSHWHRDHIGGVQDILSSIAPGCKVWKFERTDIQDLNDYNVTICKLENEQEFAVEGATLRVIHTPGHTTDHVILWLKEENSIFSGDCILGEGTTVFENLYDYMQSLYKIQKLNAATIYPGHGPIINDAEDRIKQYIQHRLDRENEVLSLMTGSPNKKKWTARELVEIMYKDKPEKLKRAAEYSINALLQKLLRENKVVNVKQVWQIKSSL